jgi:hypothetical protein
VVLFVNTALTSTLSRIIPQDGWGSEFPAAINIDESGFSRNIEQKRRVEAYRLFQEDYIKALQTCNRAKIWFFKAACVATQATKKSDKISIFYVKAIILILNSFLGYNVLCSWKIYDVALKKQSKKVWGYCDCPAGTIGECKHSFALIFKILHHQKMGDIVLQEDFDLPTPTGNVEII